MNHLRKLIKNLGLKLTTPSVSTSAVQDAYTRRFVSVEKAGFFKLPNMKKVFISSCTYVPYQIKSNRKAKNDFIKKLKNNKKGGGGQK